MILVLPYRTGIEHTRIFTVEGHCAYRTRSWRRHRGGVGLIG
jgi:hypothetical protein